MSNEPIDTPYYHNVSIQPTNISTITIIVPYHQDNWPKLIEGGILDSLSTMGFSLELEIQREVAASLCSLSLSEPHRVEIAYKCILAMVHLASSGDSDVTRQATGGLANLAEEVDTHEYISRAGGGRAAINLMVGCWLLLRHHRCPHMIALSFGLIPQYLLTTSSTTLAPPTPHNIPLITIELLLISL